jgi:hypothetical protein
MKKILSLIIILPAFSTIIAQKIIDSYGIQVGYQSLKMYYINDLIDKYNTYLNNDLNSINNAIDLGIYFRIKPLKTNLFKIRLNFNYTHSERTSTMGIGPSGFYGIELISENNVIQENWIWGDSSDYKLTLRPTSLIIGLTPLLSLNFTNRINVSIGIGLIYSYAIIKQKGIKTYIDYNSWTLTEGQYLDGYHNFSYQGLINLDYMILNNFAIGFNIVYRDIKISSGEYKAFNISKPPTTYDFKLFNNPEIDFSGLIFGLTARKVIGK